MYLCHKCAGLLIHDKSENVVGLNDCRCMSSYFRGFEPNLSREQAINTQINNTIERVELYEAQRRSEREIDQEMENLERLMLLKETK